MLMTLCLCIGNPEDVLTTPVRVFDSFKSYRNKTSCTCIPRDINLLTVIDLLCRHRLSRGGTTTMTYIMIILSQCCALQNMSTASRQLFSLARDQRRSLLRRFFVSVSRKLKPPPTPAINPRHQPPPPSPLPDPLPLHPLHLRLRLPHMS